MAPPSKKQLKKGAYGYGDDPESYEFLRIDRDPWEASASTDTYQGRRFDDDNGYERGCGAYTDCNDGLRNKLPYEQRGVSDKMRDILDDVDGMGSGNAITGGGGPLPKN